MSHQQLDNGGGGGGGGDDGSCTCTGKHSPKNNYLIYTLTTAIVISRRVWTALVNQQRLLCAPAAMSNPALS